MDVCLDGDAALAATSATPFDAIVLDIMLPGRDGLNVLRQLRGRKKYLPVPVSFPRAAKLIERVEGLNANAE